MYYHVTRKRNLKRIMKDGIRPSRPADFEDEEAVFLFPDETSMEEGVMNWLGERFDEDEELVAVLVDPNRIPDVEFYRVSGIDFEILTKSTIPPSAIVDTLEL